MSERKIELIAKAPKPKSAGKISKEEFNIDIKKKEATCPEKKLLLNAIRAKILKGKSREHSFFLKKLVMSIYSGG